MVFYPFPTNSLAPLLIASFKLRLLCKPFLVRCVLFISKRPFSLRDFENALLEQAVHLSLPIRSTHASPPRLFLKRSGPFVLENKPIHPQTRHSHTPLLLSSVEILPRAQGRKQGFFFSFFLSWEFHVLRDKRGYILPLLHGKAPNATDIARFSFSFP